jgi:hypothetical protein
MLFMVAGLAIGQIDTLVREPERFETTVSEVARRKRQRARRMLPSAFVRRFDSMADEADKLLRRKTPG